MLDTTDQNARCSNPDDIASLPEALSSLNQNNDPYLKGNTSIKNQLARAAWGVIYLLLFRYSPRPLHAWRSLVLRVFGAEMGRNCHVYPKARIWAPWNLECEDVVAIADDVIIYNPSVVRLGSHSIISQQAFLCGATHDYNDPDFPMVSAPIVIKPYAWICARATVYMGVTVAEGAILGLGGVATKDLDPWTIYGGIPPRKIKERPKFHAS